MLATALMMDSENASTVVYAPKVEKKNVQSFSIIFREEYRCFLKFNET